MDIQGKTFLHLAQYFAPYEGNFIRSLVALEFALEKDGAKMVYVFPKQTGKQPWFAKFQEQHQVYLTADDMQFAENDILSILQDIKPNVVHCHFDGFDIPTAKACYKYTNNIEQIWHLHNVKGVTHHGWRKLYWGIRFALHYGYYGRNASIISVGNYMSKFSARFHKIVCLRDFKRRATIPNGIDLSRIGRKENYEHHTPFTFIAHGGRNSQKRIDILLQAALIGRNEGADFCVKLTDGCDTKSVVSDFFNGSIPSWCQVIDQNDDINQILSQADCFVSSSIHEGHSYAICEASIYGLPIIQSDVDGNLWNAGNPSVFSFPSLDAHALWLQMSRIIKADTKNIALACAATCKTNESLYSIDRWCQNIIEYYKKL